MMSYSLRSHDVITRYCVLRKCVNISKYIRADVIRILFTTVSFVTFSLNDCTTFIRNMDWEHIRQNGYAAWQVIPLFFTTYIGMVLVCGGSAELLWNWYRKEEIRDNMWTKAWVELGVGACMLFLAILYSIVVCLIVPVAHTVYKRRQRERAQHVLSTEPEPEAVSVEGVVDTWIATSHSDASAQYR